MRKSFLLDIDPEWLAIQAKAIEKYNASPQEREDQSAFLAIFDSKNVNLLFSELLRVVEGIPDIGSVDTSGH